MVSLSAASNGDRRFASMLELIQAGEGALSDAKTLIENPAASAVFELDEVRLIAPLPNPRRLRDCSLFIEHLAPAFRGMARKAASSAPDPEAEYERLMATGDYDIPAIFTDTVVYYNCDATAISGPEDVIVAPAETKQMDYELEFACVLGKSGKNIAEADAKPYIFGYTLFNDWSARDVQNYVMSSKLGPARGKDFDGSNTLGPCIVTADELVDPYSMHLQARVNGEIWSDGNSSTIEHSFEKAIAHFSLNRTVLAGDVIGTGTVLSGSPIEIGRALNDGDVVELEADAIGVLRNRVDLPY